MKLTRLSPIVLAALLAASPVVPARAQDGESQSPTRDVDALIADLGADDFAKRDAAQQKLEALGERAIPALEKAEKESKDAEVRARAHEAVAAIRKGKGGVRPADREREGAPPAIPRPAPIPAPRPRGAPVPEPGEMDIDEFFKMFEGKGGPMGELPKIFERLQKQLEEGLGEEEQPAQGQRNGGFRVFKFGPRGNVPATPRTPAERKLGLAVEPASAALRAQLDLSPTDAGLVVNELAPNKAAWKAGLKPYDVIVALDGKPIRTAADLAGLGEREGKLEVIRKAKRETLLVHAAAAAPEAPEAPAPAMPKPPKAPEAQPSPDDNKPKDPIRKF